MSNHSSSVENDIGDSQKMSLNPAILGMSSGSYGARLSSSMNIKERKQLFEKLEEWRHARKEKLTTSIIKRRKASIDGNLSQLPSPKNRTILNHMHKADIQQSQLDGKKNVFDRLYGNKEISTQKMEESKSDKSNVLQKPFSSKPLKKNSAYKVPHVNVTDDEYQTGVCSDSPYSKHDTQKPNYSASINTSIPVDDFQFPIVQENLPVASVDKVSGLNFRNTFINVNDWHNDNNNDDDDYDEDDDIEQDQAIGEVAHPYITEDDQYIAVDENHYIVLEDDQQILVESIHPFIVEDNEQIIIESVPSYIELDVAREEDYPDPDAAEDEQAITSEDRENTVNDVESIAPEDGHDLYEGFQCITEENEEHINPEDVEEDTHDTSAFTEDSDQSKIAEDEQIALLTDRQSSPVRNENFTTDVRNSNVGEEENPADGLKSTDDRGSDLNITCTVTSTPKPINNVHLREKLQDWLTEHGHATDKYKHLLRFEAVPCELQDSLRQRTDELSGVSCSSARNTALSESYGESDKENVTPSAAEVAAKDIEGCLVNLHHLIVHVKYPRDRCEEWLKAISRKHPSCNKLLTYWECVAAINGETTRPKNPSECYGNENEMDYTETALTQMLGKLAIDEEVSSSPRIERGLSIKNIFHSKTVKFVLKEKKLNQSDSSLGKDECQKVLVATPVRRSTRIQTPAKPNVLGSLKSLDPETRRSLSFKPNEALLTE